MRLKGRQVLAACVTAASVGGGFYASVWIESLHTPSFEKVKSSYRPSDLWIVDRHGRPIESIRTELNYRSLSWIPFASVSSHYLDLLVQAEDRRFRAHHGVDPRALLRALITKLRGFRAGGASTLTMQVARITGRDSRSPTFRAKIRQILSALWLDYRWSKEQILEAHLNLVPFRGELIGLHAASRGLFKKSPSQLSRVETALLVALLWAPNATPAQVARRACAMIKRNQCPEAKRRSHALASAYQLPRGRENVPVLSNSIKRPSSDHSLIATSLDGDIQSLALRVMREQLRELRPSNVQDAAVVVLDNRTGEALAYAANGGPRHSSASYVDGAQMRRQAGSTLKPFVYATAFDLNILSPEALLEDTAVDISIGGGRVYHPRNYDEVFRGFVSVAEALGSSLNVPAVRALRLVSEEAVLKRMRSLGFTHLRDDEHYGLSLALGAVDISLWELTQAYRKLAPRAKSSPFSEGTRKMIFAMLALPEYRRFTFGADSILNLPFPAAVKTGTSKDMRDNWCVGFTEDHTVGVWVGNFSGEPMWNVSGTSGAAPIFHRLMRALYGQSDRRSQRPARYVHPNQPLRVRTMTKITYPAQNMLVARDPEIPARVQKMPIDIENPQPHHRLFINDLFLGRASARQYWSLGKGRFKLLLTDADGKIVDAVNFEVR